MTKGRPWKPHCTHVSSLPGKKAEASQSLILLSYVNVFLGCSLGCLCVFFYWFNYYAGASIVSRCTGFLFLNNKKKCDEQTHKMFSLSLLIIPPAQQKDPLNSGCAHDISIVVGASLAARPGAEKLRLDKNKEETLVGTREKEEALRIPSPSSIWKQILFPSPADLFCLGVIFHGTHFFFKTEVA